METLYPDLLKKVWNELLQNGSFDDIVKWYQLLSKSQQSIIRSWMKEIEIDIFYKIMKECVIQFVNDIDWDFFDDYESDYNFARLGYDRDYKYNFLYEATKNFLNELSDDDLKHIENGELYSRLYRSFTIGEQLSKEFNDIRIVNPFDFYKMKKDKSLPKSIRSIAKESEKNYYKRCEEYILAQRSSVIQRMNIDQFNEFYKFVQFQIKDLRYDKENEKEIDDYFHCLRWKLKYLYTKFDIDFLHLF